MKIDCPCGHVISDTTDFIQHKAILVADQDHEDMMDEWEAVIDAAQGLATIVDPIERAEAERRVRFLPWRILSKYDRFVYQCSECRRLFVDDIEHTSHVFSPDDAETPWNLLRSIRGDLWPRHLRGDWYARYDESPPGSLWWGSGDAESGYETFDEWDRLEARYHEVFQRLRAREILRHAWLRRDRETIHDWSPAKRPPDQES